MVYHRLYHAEIEFTSGCNLRCTYCAVSGDNYQSLNLPAERYSEILDHLKSVGVGHVQINGHGETTNMPAGWRPPGPSLNISIAR